VRSGVDDSARDVRLRISECDRAQRHAAVDVGVAVGIVDATARGLDEMGRAVAFDGAVECLGALAAGRCASRENSGRAGAPRDVLDHLGGRFVLFDLLRTFLGLDDFLGLSRRSGLLRAAIEESAEGHGGKIAEGGLGGIGVRVRGLTASVVGAGGDRV
jgi:hypothetical protein